MTAIGCLQINVKVPELAAMERQRKQSWSMVVGGTDSRSVGTGLNELDRVIGGSGVKFSVQCFRIKEKGLGGFSYCTEYEILSGGLVHVYVRRGCF